MQRFFDRLSVCCAIVVLIYGESVEAKPTPIESSAELQKYVAKPDSSYAWKVRRRGELGSGKYAELTLTSQTWHGIVWKHQMFIYQPANLKNASQALLLIDGGSWKDSLEAPPTDDETLPDQARVFAALADMMQTPVAIVRQVPQQPIFDGKVEDQIIALTFSKFLESGESDWPLLLPMVKSAVRSMDAVQEFAKQEWKLDIERFTVTGASKRGWTTWLTSATDQRVNALAPMVINMLNMAEHDRLQRESFGGYSEQIHDYTERGLHDWLATEQGAALRAIVDPYAYRKHLLQPKLIILATNDAYWPVDSLNLYWDDLVGDKYILYVPNNGHGIRDYGRVIATMTALQRSLTGGKPLPKLTWRVDERSEPARLELECDVAPTAVRQWTAAADTRDFRQSEWSSTSLAKAGDNKFVAELAHPASGYNAMFLEAEFPGDPTPFNLSTTLHVFASGDDDKTSTNGATAE